MNRYSRVWPSAIAACGMGAAAAWGLGRVVTDRFGSIQFLHWIPNSVALSISVLCAVALIQPKWIRMCRMFWMVALVQLAMTLTQDYGFVRRGIVDPSGESPTIRIAHFNANWPGRDAALFAPKLRAYFQRNYRAGGPDVFILSECGAMLGDQFAGVFAPSDAIAITVGRFGVVSRVPIVEARVLFDDLKSTAAVLRFAAWEGNQSFGVLLVDFPSDPVIARWESFSRLRNQLAAMQIDSPDVIVGDFNAVRGGASLTEFAPTMNHAFEQAGVGLGATFPRGFPLWHIDHILVGPLLTTTHYETVDLGLGKHRMQIATLRAHAPTTAGASP